MTHAFCAIGHGELGRAVGYNALSPFLFLAALAAWAHAAATLLNLRPAREALERLRPNAAASKLLLLIVVVWWVARLRGGF
jgi:hypothetical protein